MLGRRQFGFILIVTLLISLTLSLPVGADTREYLYRFENLRFDISFIEIKVAANGESEMRFKKRDEDSDNTVKFVLLPSTIERIQGFFTTLKFFDSRDAYQADKQFTN